MKKVGTIISLMLAIALAPIAFTGCAGTTAGGAVTSVQSWLNDPKNQAIIQEIAAAANILIGALGRTSATSQATVVGKLAVDYPNVPAGALRTIAKNPQAYLKK